MTKAFGFLGMRPGKFSPEIENSCRDALYYAVDRAREQGYKVCVSSILPGVELLGAFSVVAYTPIELHIVFPYKVPNKEIFATDYVYSDGAALTAKDYSAECLRLCKKTTYTEEEPTNLKVGKEQQVWVEKALLKLNRCIINKVELLISFWDYQDDYEVHSLRYAIEKKKIKVANFNPLTAKWKLLDASDLP